jgi:hypothetical protein
VPSRSVRVAHATIAISEDADDGDCVLTFTVTFDDDTTQTLTVTVPIETPAPETGSISGTVTEAGTPGDIGDGDLHRCG